MHGLILAAEAATKKESLDRLAGHPGLGELADQTRTARVGRDGMSFGEFGHLTVVPLTPGLDLEVAGEITPALTSSARFRELLGQRLFELCGQFGLDNNETEAVLLGRGAQTLAHQLNLMNPVARVHADGLGQVEARNVLLVPLFPEDGSLEEVGPIAAALEGTPRPFAVEADGRTYVVDRPFLHDPGLGAVVADVVRYHQAMKKRPAGRLHSAIA